VSNLEVVVHADRCMGSGGCRKAAPTVFGADSEGWVSLLDSMPSRDLLDDLLEAYDVCPVAAIEVLNDRWEPLT